jgi:glycosyltransferase involved in cell wall biosynthesis
LTRVLFASYDGIADGPGRSQTIPYLRGLAERGHAMAMFSYERPDVLADAARVAEIERELGGAPWTRVTWRRSPARDLASGLAAMRRAARAHGAELVHARGYVPAFLARRLGRPYLFDMRGFWPDERADGGLWTRKSVGYRFWKRIEKDLCRKADGIVVLTRRAADELRRLGLARASTPVRVIRTCADLTKFRPIPPRGRPAECRGDAPRYLIFGATGTWYLREETLDLAARALLRDPRAKLHVLTRDEPAPLVEGLARRGVDARRTLVRSVPPTEAPQWISGAAAAIVLIRSTWSKGASCPTKLGELLGCGVPVLMNAGVGDGDVIFDGSGAGVTVTAFDEASYDAALDGLAAMSADGGVAARCRALAEREFALPAGVDRYDAAYRGAVGACPARGAKRREAVHEPSASARTRAEKEDVE